LSADTATIVASGLAGGTHALSARYVGSGDHAASASDTLAHVVTGALTVTTLQVSPDSSVHLASISLTATVTPAAATGTVEFFDGATSLGSAALTGGSAPLSVSDLTVGGHALWAAYGGDGDHAASASDTVAHEVKAQILATAGPNGTLAPLGATLWSRDDTPAFTFAADSGFHVASVTVDGAPVAPVSPFVFSPPLASNHTIDVQFAVNPPVQPITDLVAQQRKTGNDADGTTAISVAWSGVAPGDSVYLYRAAFGGYPEYDDAGGAVPAVPSSHPPASWTLAAIVAGVSTVDDQPPARDFWYYVAFVKDSLGTFSAVSNPTAGTLDYHLGDVRALSPAPGDNRVNTLDVSMLGAHYGKSLAPGDTLALLDVGPTTDLSTNSRPATDDQIDFEDLLLFAINFSAVSAPLASPAPVPAAEDELALELPTRSATAGAGEAGELEVRLHLRSTGRVLGLSATLAWNPRVVEPIGTAAGAIVTGQGGVLFSPGPGRVDVACLGARRGFAGEGELATLRFRVLAEGDPGFALSSVDARDAANRKVGIALTTRSEDPAVPAITSLGRAAPNPFAAATTLAFALAHPGRVELAVFSVDGRRVRTLAIGPFAAGEHRATWDGRDDQGRVLSAGIYYAHLSVGRERFTRRLTLLR
jgi:hypothetical protein